MQDLTNYDEGQISNNQVADSGGKTILEDPTMMSQLLNGYVDIGIIKDIRPEDIVDVTERFIPMFTEERDADVVKKVHVRTTTEEFDFFIALIEHKSGVDYNVVMQLLRYMVLIWEDFEHQMEKKSKGISKTKGFKYPPVLPIVYYEGQEEWTASTELAERIALNETFFEYVPNYRYYLISLNKYDREELIEKKDAMSFVMLLNRIKSAEEFKNLNLPDGYFDNLQENSPDEVLAVIAKVIAVMLRKQNVPENDINNMVDQIKRREHMALFDGWQGFDVQEERKNGEEIKLIKMVRNKQKQGWDVKKIADAFDEEEKHIQEICDVLSIHDSDFEADKIFEEITKNRKENLVENDSK